MPPPSFTIDTPGIGDLKVAPDGGNLVVTVSNDGLDRFSAVIFDNPGSGSGGTYLPQVGSTNQYSAPVPVGVVPSSRPYVNNKCVTVTGETSLGKMSITHEFECWTGDQGSQEVFVGIQSKKRSKLFSKDTPVPVAMLLKLDSKIAAGTCAKCSRLNEPTVLRHSDDAKYASSWFSEPIVFCAKKAEAGIWMLEKTSASTWTLTLQCGKDAIVTYLLKSKKKKACKLPMQLSREGKGGKQCTKWPKTVTVEPAP